MGMHIIEAANAPLWIRSHRLIERWEVGPSPKPAAMTGSSSSTGPVVRKRQRKLKRGVSGSFYIGQTSGPRSGVDDYLHARNRQGRPLHTGCTQGATFMYGGRFTVIWCALYRISQCVIKPRFLPHFFPLNFIKGVTFYRKLHTFLPRLLEMAWDEMFNLHHYLLQRTTCFLF